MKTKYIKSKIVSSPKANWTDIDFYYDVKPFYKTLAIATCSHCKKEVSSEPLLTTLEFMLLPVLIVLFVELL